MAYRPRYAAANSTSGGIGSGSLYGASGRARYTDRYADIRSQARAATLKSGIQDRYAEIRSQRESISSSSLASSYYTKRDRGVSLERGGASTLLKDSISASRGSSSKDASAGTYPKGACLILSHVIWNRLDSILSGPIVTTVLEEHCTTDTSA